MCSATVSSIRKIFDWQAGFGINVGVTNGSGFIFKGLDLPKFYKYDNVKIDIYGAARRGNVWKGKPTDLRELKTS